MLQLLVDELLRSLCRPPRSLTLLFLLAMQTSRTDGLWSRVLPLLSVWWTREQLFLLWRGVLCSSECKELESRPGYQTSWRYSAPEKWWTNGGQLQQPSECLHVVIRTHLSSRLIIHHQFFWRMRSDLILTFMLSFLRFHEVIEAFVAFHPSGNE